MRAQRRQQHLALLFTFEPLLFEPFECFQPFPLCDLFVGRELSRALTKGLSRALTEGLGGALTEPFPLCDLSVGVHG